ncbi:MAG TPA: hypothetical protein VLM44_10675 [Lutibacter sp.]|nr:hypothetical protein [Lutibacter sp.]
MKKIFKSLIYVTVIAFFAVSCDENDTVFTPLSFPEDAFIAFEDASPITVLESNTAPIEIIVNYANTLPNAKTAVTVDYTITSETAVKGVHYTIVGEANKLTFAPGELNAKIIIIPIDNLMEDGNKVLNITLTNSSVAVGLPGPDASNKSIVVTLTDDDCAFTFADLDGVKWIGTDNATGDNGPNQTQITTSFDGTNLLMGGIAYGWLTGPWDEVVVDSEPVIVVMDPVTGVFTIAEQYLCTTTWNGSVQDDYSISATGQYFSCLTKMTVNYTLYQGGAVLRRYTETIEF